MKSSNRYAKSFNASRAGAKAAFSHPTLEEVLKMAEQLMAHGNESAAKTVIDAYFREYGKGGTQTKSSRAGAKAKFAHPLPASLESALKNLDVKIRMLRHAYESNDIEAMSGAGDRVLEAAERVASTSDSAAASLSRVGHHYRTGAKAAFALSGTYEMGGRVYEVTGVSGGMVKFRLQGDTTNATVIRESEFNDMIRSGGMKKLNSRAGAKSDGLTLAQRIAVEHDAKRMAAR